MARWVAQRDANYNSQRKLGAILIGKLTQPGWASTLGCEFQPDHILQLTKSSALNCPVKYFALNQINTRPRDKFLEVANNFEDFRIFVCPGLF